MYVLERQYLLEDFWIIITVDKVSCLYFKWRVICAICYLLKYTVGEVMLPWYHVYHYLI